MIDKFGLTLLTMFGVGRINKAPGTWASITTVLIYLFIFFYIDFKIVVLIFFTLLILSIFLIDKLSHHFKNKDPKEIVIDEFLGQSIPILVVYYYWDLICASECASGQPRYEITWILWIVVIGSFRFFDILKIYPINLIDKKFKNGFGVVFDDMVAGLYSAIFIYIYIRLFYFWAW